MKLSPLILATNLASLATAQLRDPVSEAMKNPLPEAITLTIKLATTPATPPPTSTATVVVKSWLEKCCLFAPEPKFGCDSNPECVYRYAQNSDNPYYKPPKWKPAPPPVGDSVQDGHKRAVDGEDEGMKLRTRELDSKAQRRDLVDDMHMKEKCKGLWKSDKTKHRDACAKEASGQNTCMLKSLLDDASEECKAAIVKAMGFNN